MFERNQGDMRQKPQNAVCRREWWGRCLKPVITVHGGTLGDVNSNIAAFDPIQIFWITRSLGKVTVTTVP